MNKIIIIGLIISLLIIGVFLYPKNNNFFKAGGSKSVMTLHTGQPQKIVLDIKMGEIPKGTNVTLNNKTTKEGDVVNLKDNISIQWGET